MTRIQSLAVLAASAIAVQGHFTFIRLAHNGEWKAPTQYIRNKTEPFEELTTPNTNVNTRLYNFPTFISDYPESVRCGRDNMAHAAGTEVLSVKAGDTIEVAHTRNSPDYWADDQWYDCPDDRGSCNPQTGFMDFNHPGPIVAHLSKTPEGVDVHDYDGSGEWTKIYSLGLEVKEDSSVRWRAYNYRGLPERFIFTIPEETPAGDYLLRMDLVVPGLWEPPIYTADVPQLYATCAHLSIASEATGSLPEGVKIPEVFYTTEPGMRTSLNMSRQESLDEGYVNPGGLLWDGVELVEDDPTVLGQLN